MTEEPTPRTDAVIANDTGDSSYIKNLAEIARALERELSAVRGELEEAKGMASIAIKRCGALTTERDKLRAELEESKISDAAGDFVGKALGARNAELLDERDQLRATNAGLLEALRGLIEEYTDREFQFGGDYLWQKHEDKETVDKARAAIAGAEKQPAPQTV